jgi:hypothetical protein
MIRGFLSACLLVAVVAAITVRVMSLMNIPGQPAGDRWALQDFRDATYYPVVAFLDGVNPYDRPAYLDRYPVLLPFLPYSPLTLVVHLPFGLLSHGVSQIVYYGLSVGLSMLLAVVSLRMNGVRPTITSMCLLSAAVIASRAGHMNLSLGQTSLELVLATYVALYFGGSRDWTSGLGFVGATLKPTFGLPVLILMIASGFRRALIMGLAMTLVLTAVPTVLVMHAAGGPAELIESLLEGMESVDSDLVSSPVLSPGRIDGAALVARITGKSPGVAAQIAIFIATMFVASCAIRKVRRRFVGAGTGAFCLGVAAVAMMVGIYQQTYNALLLVAPLTGLVVGRWAPEGLEAPEWARWSLFGLMLVPVVNYAATFDVLDRLPSGSLVWFLAAGSNGLALVLALGLYVWLAFRGFPVEPPESASG